MKLMFLFNKLSLHVKRYFIEKILASFILLIKPSDNQNYRF